MIGAISNNQNMSFGRPENKLTSEQSDTVKTTLAQFDAQNLSEEDAKSIVETFKEAGIQPSKALAEHMSELGFDAKSVGELAGVKPPRHPLKGQASSAVDLEQAVDFLSKSLKEQDIDSLNEEQKQALFSELKSEFGLEEGSSFVKIKV
ncbi:hypothetical protein L1286_02910 [Pseudoalteromonas sp. SMS1]|uniref:hypothetical protein n=1 Tax=Pseudoalteromonas sp. SMS1 TaxID=2908894 RepID=UPI001F308574|nr:hypothetical protein [Pseudoalteromonas sp. SMS1]MCF2856408.1 hypothetical protein [Pseudoalteromonas sp. SMS1]